MWFTVKRCINIIAAGNTATGLRPCSEPLVHRVRYAQIRLLLGRSVCRYSDPELCHRHTTARRLHDRAFTGGDPADFGRPRPPTFTREDVQGCSKTGRQPFGLGGYDDCRTRNR